MNNLDKVRVKIEALLKKTEANGASEHEAQFAMLKAQQLMEEHGISLEDLSHGVKQSDFIRRKFSDGKKLSILDRYVAASIARYTDTKVWNDLEFAGYKNGRTVNGKRRINTTSNLTFYGFAVDVELAHYIYKVCDAAMETEWKTFSVGLPTGQRKAARSSFMLGMAVRLRTRLTDLKQQNVQKTSDRNQLVVLKNQLVERAAKEELNLGHMKKGYSSSPSVVNGNAYYAGQEAADRVRFNREVEDGPTGGVKLIA